MARVDGHEVQIGDWICFKSDIEQSGKVIAIDGNTLTLEDKDGFSGGYIGGETITTERASDCWIE